MNFPDIPFHVFIWELSFACISFHPIQRSSSFFLFVLFLSVQRKFLKYV